MIIYPVASSSKGNCTYIQSEQGVAVLVDVGVGLKTIDQSLSRAGFSLSSVCAILITHEHTDHVSGLNSLIKKHNVPIYGAAVTFENLVRKNLLDPSLKFVEVDFRRFNIFDLNCGAFGLMHDSVCCFGFTLRCGSKKIAMCTDLGCVTQGVLNNLKDSGFVFIESNFDANMLKNGKYPNVLKKRILSKYGHLSNDETARVVCWLVSCCKTRRFLLGHLSQHNNLPELAIETIESNLNSFNFKRNVDYFLDVAPVKSSGVFYEV